MMNVRSQYVVRTLYCYCNHKDELASRYTGDYTHAPYTSPTAEHALVSACSIMKAQTITEVHHHEGDLPL
jgi:hypothetical protein